MAELVRRDLKRATPAIRAQAYLSLREIKRLPELFSAANAVGNRLTSVNGVTYTWDNNGNLLNDGVNTYTYDAVNRLMALSGQLWL